MTIGIIYRVPGLGAVLGCDSRVLGGGGDDIITDHDEKWLVAGSTVACCAGELGGVWHILRAEAPRSWPELWKALTLSPAERGELAYEVLAYCRRTDTLWHTDHTGGAIRRGVYAAIGAGSAAALGALDASPAPKTLEAAARLVRRALEIACKRHASCGGRLRVIVVRGRRGAISAP